MTKTEKEGVDMPHVIVKMWPGRTEAQKKACAAAVARAVVDTIDDVTDELMSVSIMEIPQEQWDYKINKIDRVDKDAVLYIPKGKTRDEW